MAAPIAHIFCALSLLNAGKLTVTDKCAFILGTSFPDIRYLGVIERNETHDAHVTWTDVEHAKSDFEKGRLLHAYLDIKREAYIVDNKLYDGMADTAYKTHILKFFEDTLLWKKIKTWDKICTYFDTILPEEQAFNIDPRHIHVWHSLLKKYVKQQPGPQDISHFLAYLSNIKLKEKNIIKYVIKKIKSIIINKIIYFKLSRDFKQLADNQKLQQKIMHFYDNIAKEF